MFKLFVDFIVCVMYRLAIN